MVQARAIRLTQSVASDHIVSSRFLWKGRVHSCGRGVSLEARFEKENMYGAFRVLRLV